MRDGLVKKGFDRDPFVHCNAKKLVIIVHLGYNEPAKAFEEDI